MKRCSLAVPEPSTLVSDLRRHRALGRNLRKLATCTVGLGVQPSYEEVWLQNKLEFPLAKVLSCIFADKLLLFFIFFVVATPASNVILCRRWG